MTDISPRQNTVETEAVPAASDAALHEPDATLGTYARARVAALRAGELGSLPIIVGIIVIAVYFQARNDQFLSAGNFVNLIAQMAAIAIIGMGIVFVLLLGEIDLSIGFVSGVGGVITALLLVDDGNSVSPAIAIIVALSAGLSIGLLQGLIFAKVGIPSFVVTLAGLLGWNGAVLLLIGDRGTVPIQNTFVNGIANDYLSSAGAWIAVEGAVVGYAILQFMAVRTREKAGLPNLPLSLILLRIGTLAGLGAIVVIVANSAENRGLPYVGLLLIALMLVLTFVTDRTRFGRHVYAVGGNVEAARRAGIRVDRIRIAVFGIAGAMAALGGIILASRLSSVDTNAGGGTILLYSIAAPVIGGTSLFGGRGTIRSALLGAVVIASIDNGLGLLNTTAGTKYIVTALVLLAAVSLDSLSRKGRTASGRA